MNKIWIVIKREYLSRVKKRSFAVMTILGPLLMAAFIIVPYYVAKYTEGTKVIDVVDDTGIYKKHLGSNENVKFNYLDMDIDAACDTFKRSDSYALLHIMKPDMNLPKAHLFYLNKQPGMTVISYIEDRIQAVFENKILEDSCASIRTIKELRRNKIRIEQSNIITGEETDPLFNSILGYAAGLLIYLFIFLFGSMVMRGVLEEKTNRIVEVIVSSVKPFQLMMGKIIGIALVGLTQFLLWIVLTFSIVGIFSVSVGAKDIVQKDKKEWVVGQNVVIPDNPKIHAQETGDTDFNNIMSTLWNYNFAMVLLAFIFYFLFGYLMYGALFAAIGSAVDNETDTQQFMMPITIPLIFAFIMGMYIMENPQGPLAFWLSVIPLTSPVVMMIRMPFNPPVLDICLSMALLILTFLGTTWMAGKIYRTGILMYGKKISYRELWKWITYKN